MSNLENEPGWKEWRRKRIARTLYFDDPFQLEDQLTGDFFFSDAIEKQHAVVIQYLGLAQKIHSLKECEYYFRRYPFRGLPVSRQGHITNVCEMYFSRFYEFKDRMKRYFEAIKVIEPDHGLDIGKFIKHFEKIFYEELRTRNGVHHGGRYEDIDIDRIFLTEIMSLNDNNKGWNHEHTVAYRKSVSKWVQRVRNRGAKMDTFLEAIARATLATCTFLKTS